MGGQHAAEGQPGSARVQHVHSSVVPLLNRTHPLAELEDLLADSTQGTGRAVFVLGEAGSGKSALVRAMLLRARSSPARVAVARSYEGDDAVPYAPWDIVLQQLADISPTIAELVTSGELLAGDPNATGRRVALAVTTVSRSHPIVLIFEDIGNADESSLIALRLLAQRIADTAILLVMTLNTDGDAADTIQTWMTRVIRESQARQIELHPVRPAAISDFVRTRHPEIESRELERIVLDLERLSGGNALFLSELLAVLDAHLPHSTTLTERLRELPVSLSAAVEHRAGQLTPHALQTLRIAAIVGNVIDIDLLATLRGSDPDDIIDDLEEAMAHGLLTDDPQGLRFRHGVFRRGLIDQVSHVRRRRYHAEIARVLQSRPQSRPVDVAFHAERAGDVDLACTYYERAAHTALAAHALPEAIHSLRRALALAESATLTSERQDELRLALADSLLWTDDEAAERELSRVLTRAQIRDDVLTLARANQIRAILLYERGARNASLALLERVIPELERSGDMAALASALTYAGYCFGSLSDFDQLDGVADRLSVVARELDDSTHRAAALHFKSYTLIARGHPDNAPALGRESVNIMAELGHVEIASAYAQVVLMRVDLFANLRHPTMVDNLVRQGEELERISLERIGVPRASDVAEYAYFRFLRGDTETIRRVLPGPDEIRDAPLPQVSKDIGHNIAAEIAEIEGRLDDADRLLRYVAPSPDIELGDHAYQQWLSAVWRSIGILVARNDLAESRRWLDVMQQALEILPHVPGELWMQISRARLAAATGNIRSAEAILRQAQNRAEDTHNMLALIEALQLLSAVLIRSDRARDALDTATVAVRHAEQCHLPYHAAVSRVYRVEALRASSAPTETIFEDSDAARETLESMNAQLMLSRLQRTQQPAPRRWPSGLTDREVDVLRLLTQGLPDHQIAERLFISRRTVTTHVGNMLGKTHSANRTELAMWAVRHGLASSTPRGDS